MSIALYMDVHVPRPVTIGLRLRGVDVMTAQDDGSERTADPDLLERATALGRVLVTQDDDLLVEAARRQAASESFAGVVFGRQLDLTVGRMVRDLELIAKACDPADMESRVEYVPL